MQKEKNHIDSDLLHKFNESLGDEKSKVFDNLVSSFNSFLEINYSHQQSYDSKIISFLNDYNNSKNWKIDKTNFLKVRKQLETSRLRKDIKLYGYEDYKPICFLEQSNNNMSTNDTFSMTEEFEEVEIVFPEDMDSTDIQAFYEKERKLQNKIDSSLSINLNGLYLCSLEKLSTRDTVIHSYIKAVNAVGDISRSILTKGYQDESIDYENPIHIRMLVVDLYLDMVYYYTKN